MTSALIADCIKNKPQAGFHPEGIILGGGGGGGGEAPGNGCGFIYFSIKLSQIWGGGGASPPPSG